jgi:hypothetical protein
MAKGLTAKQVENAKPRAVRVELPDAGCSGLYLIIQPSGARSWAVRYRFAGKPRKLTLEPEPGAPPLTLAVPRASWRLTRSTRSRTASTPARRSGTGSRRARMLLPPGRRIPSRRWRGSSSNATPRVKNKSWQQVEAILNRKVLPRWKGRSVHDITREDVEDLIDAIAADRPIMANRVLSALRKWFGWMGGKSKGGRKAILQSRLRITPCLGVEAPGQERSRDRVLTDAEIVSLWTACDEEGEPFVHSERRRGGCVVLRAQGAARQADEDVAEFVDAA